MLFFNGIKRAAPVSLSKRLFLVFPWLHAELLLPFRPEVAEFQEHAVYLSRIMHVVTPQTERIVKMHAVQEETWGISWNHRPLLSNKAFHIRSMRVPVQFHMCAWMCIIVAHTGEGKHFLLKHTYKKYFKSLTRSGFTVTFLFFFFWQNKHRHIVMYFIFSTNLNKIFTFSQVDL